MSALSQKGDTPIRQHSAGGVVVRANRVLLISTRNGTRWQLPKGRIEGSETAAQAAAREVEEETGVLGHVLDPLDTIDCIYQRRSGRTVHKRIDLFLLGYRSGTVEDYDPNEVTEARWFSWADALAALTYDNERGVVELARQAWRRALIEDPSTSATRCAPGLRPIDQPLPVGQGTPSLNIASNPTEAETPRQRD